MNGTIQTTVNDFQEVVVSSCGTSNLMSMLNIDNGAHKSTFDFVMKAALPLQFYIAMIAFRRFSFTVFNSPFKPSVPNT